jgi:laminin alpha 3/5
MLIIVIFQVHYGFNCGSGPSLIVSDRTYNDGHWHSVVFSRQHINGSLIIDGETVGQGSSKGSTKSMNIISPYYIGGISPNISSDAKVNIKVRSSCILMWQLYII